VFPLRCYWGLESSGMWRCVVGWLVSRFSKDPVAFIFKCKQSKQFHNVLGLLTVTDEAIHSVETPGTAQRRSPETSLSSVTCVSVYLVRTVKLKMPAPPSTSLKKQAPVWVGRAACVICKCRSWWCSTSIYPSTTVLCLSCKSVLLIVHEISTSIYVPEISDYLGLQLADIPTFCPLGTRGSSLGVTAAKACSCVLVCI
jgi:hypothetical protein